jgi:hypothetical protein
MKILSSLKSGFYRALKVWKGILIAWLVMLILVSFITIPLRGGLRSGFGNSMITEKLAEGFDLEAYMDLGPTLKTLISSASSGFLFIFLIGFAANAFITGGLFGSLRRNCIGFSSCEFFGNGARNFWSFLMISVIITLIVIFLSFFIIGIPFLIISTSETISEKGAFMTGISAILVFLILLPLLLIVADYARAKKASDESFSWSRSLGFGFSLTFRNFWSSYLMMLLLILCQVIPVILILAILPGWEPLKGGGVFLLLIVSQLILYARLLLKTWRYGSFTALMEETNVQNINNPQ